VRARLGVTLTPTILLYGTGGPAYGGVNSKATISTVSTTTVAVDTSNTNFGWAAGAGLEAQLLGNWTGKIEYLHLELGSITNTLATTIPAVGGGTLTGIGSSRITDNIVRVGLNYKFTN
jgi:outer membrane immunogenic protein